MTARTVLVAALALVALAPAARSNDADQARLKKALEFLLTRQADNGGFGQIPGEAPGEIGITGLVIQALARAPEALRATARPAAEKAATFLLAHQQADGSFSQGGVGLTTYRTSIAILALGALDRARYREPIGKAVAWLKGDQHDESDHFGPASPHHGGFGYDDDTNGAPMSDMSNTQLALAALKDAGVGPDDPVFKRAIVFLTRCQNSSETNAGVPAATGVVGLKPLDDGGFIYDPGQCTDKSAMTENPDGTRSFVSYGSMTYAGLVSMIGVGLTKDDKRCQAALRWIAANYTLEENRGLGVRARDPQAAQQGLYYYYGTFARCLAALGSPTLETAQGTRRWARDLFDALAARQGDDGSFVNTKDRWWEADPVLVTAYALNAMEDALPFVPAEAPPH